MTKDEAMKIQKSSELFEAIKADEVLRRDRDVIERFNKLAFEEFKASIIESYGSYDPDRHYDFNRKK